jgi:3-keto-disaccharide hydrolase
MTRLSLALLLALSATIGFAQKTPFAGRWDFVVTTKDASYPDWLEVAEKDGAWAARMQPRTGSVHPVKIVKLDGDHLTLLISAANTKRPDTTWELTAASGKLSGIEKHGDDATAKLAGVRAPELKRDMPKAWTTAEPLFNGKDLTGWKPDDPAKNHWEAQDGILVNVEHGANLQTTRSFQDFKLHLELNCPDGGNSGVYLRGRYEMQVAYEKEPDSFHSMGAIYGMLAPTVEMPRKPGQWEAFDITLVGRWLTVVRDGTTLIDNQEIAGITGGALDGNEAEPGPFYIQGDHTGGMKYRNITIAVPKK